SAAVTVDGGVLPLSSGALSSMIRADTRSAPGAMPPGNLANGAPAAISETHVPWPTTSSMLVLLVLGSTSMYSCKTRPATVGLLRMMPLSTKPMVTPWPVYPASCAAYVLVIDNCASIGGCGVVGVVVGGGTLVGVLRTPPPPPPPQAAKANISSPGTIHRTFPDTRIILSPGRPFPNRFAAFCTHVLRQTRRCLRQRSIRPIIHETVHSSQRRFAAGLNSLGTWSSDYVRHRHRRRQTYAHRRVPRPVHRLSDAQAGRRRHQRGTAAIRDRTGRRRRSADGLRVAGQPRP